MSFVFYFLAGFFLSKAWLAFWIGGPDGVALACGAMASTMILAGRSVQLERKIRLLESKFTVWSD